MIYGLHLLCSLPALEEGLAIMVELARVPLATEPRHSTRLVHHGSAQVHEQLAHSPIGGPRSIELRLLLKWT